MLRGRGILGAWKRCLREQEEGGGGRGVVRDDL